MAGQVLKKRRLVNPGRRRRRNMTAKQIKYFGSARQRAALKNRRKRNVSRSVGRHRKRRNQGDVVSRVEHAAERAIDKIEDLAEDALHHVGIGNRNRGRRRNVGQILTVLPANPGRRKRRKKVAAVRNRRRSRRRTSNPRRRRVNRARNRAMNPRRRRRHHTVRHRRRTSNPRVVVRYRNRRRGRRNYGRRRNPNFLSGEGGKIAGVLGGAVITGLVTGFLPSNLMTGWIGYLTTAVTAGVVGGAAGAVMKSKAIGTYVTTGGMLIVALQLLHQFMPQLQLPFTVAAPATGSSPAANATTAGTAGMGLITSSNFWVPQVNQPGSMASFVPPAMLPSPVVVPTATTTAAGMHGLGAQPITGLRQIRRVGRFR